MLDTHEATFISTSISFPLQFFSPNTIKHHKDKASSFLDDVIDNRAITSLFSMQQKSEVLRGDCIITFPSNIRLYSEGKYHDRTGFVEKLSAHYIVCIALFPEGKGILTVTFDFQKQPLLQDVLDTLILLQKVWYPRELTNPPLIEINSRFGDQSSVDFVSSLVADLPFNCQPLLYEPKVAFYFLSPFLFSRLTNQCDAFDEQFSSIEAAFSGLCQNVLDYQNQDVSEIKDSLEVLHTTKDFMLFASQHFLIEIARESRSFLEGRDFIGTCPYFYFLNVLSHHNEIVLSRWASEVSNIYENVMSLRQVLPPSSRLELLSKDMKRIQKAIREFARIRLQVISDIRSNMFQNSFRYATERTVFQKIEEKRRLTAISLYWTDVLHSCEEIVDDIVKIDNTAKTKKLNLALGVLAFLAGVSALVDINQISEKISQNYSGYITIGSCAGVVAIGLYFFRKILKI